MLDQINLVVRDMDAAVAFYRRLGVDVPDATAAVGRAPPIGERHAGGIDFDLDSVVFARQWDEGWPIGRSGACVIGFKSRRATRSTASTPTSPAPGYRGQQPPYDAFWGARYAVVEDPDGNAVGLMSPMRSRAADARPPPP